MLKLKYLLCVINVAAMLPPEPTSLESKDITTTSRTFTHIPFIITLDQLPSKLHYLISKSNTDIIESIENGSAKPLDKLIREGYLVLMSDQRSGEQFTISIDLPLHQNILTLADLQDIIEQRLSITAPNIVDILINQIIYTEDKFYSVIIYDNDLCIKHSFNRILSDSYQQGKNLISHVLVGDLFTEVSKTNDKYYIEVEGHEQEVNMQELTLADIIHIKQMLQDHRNTIRHLKHKE